eukprot:CAMPEP_0117605182 /NCGR_PEP_ID=MMETSP0784-20121206/79065_1 /TAXON_ID=39447 /ORGANISM="" /LENGTH=90 /DNA_ID=CAMNT_0005408225 /DNA_START=217 /DNA_END=489 /DNA_ORIENTATION=-
MQHWTEQLSEIVLSYIAELRLAMDCVEKGVCRIQDPVTPLSARHSFCHDLPQRTLVISPLLGWVHFAVAGCKRLLRQVFLLHLRRTFLAM